VAVLAGVERDDGRRHPGGRRIHRLTREPPRK
jgi:hypothetical protein